MTLEDALKGISHHRARLHEENAWGNPVALVDIGDKLVTYNSYLADFIADFHKQASDKYHSVYLECINKDEGVTKAQQMGKGESTQERRDFEHVKFVYTATKDMVSFIQTKIRILENQLKNEVTNG